MAALKPNAASKSVFYLQAMIFFIAAAAAAALVSGLSPDGKALLELKASIEDDLGHLANWAEFDSTPCHWTGVGCSSRVENEEQRVTSLSLGNMNLSGVLAPGAIAGLTALVNLSVDVNNFSGVLPAEIATLAKLQLLNISHNNFTGAFPSNISAMISLQELDAYNNNFTGPLPIGLGKLDHLRHLHLGGSFFDGSIPAEYGSMKSIRYLALSGNVLTGRIPPELGNLVQLEHLYLGYYNVYAGGIPSELGRLKNLIRLDLSFCGLNGTIPESLGNLKKLDTLFLQINSLSGTIPESLAKLGGLKSLDLSNNQLVGGIPDTLAALEKLELVSLFRNNLSGGLPSYIGDLPNLQVLYLWDNKLRGAIPQQLGGSGKLMAIDLSTNELNGSVPVNLCYGGQLEVLILRENQLTGSIPDSLGSCSSLVKVRLGDNLLTGPIPKGLFSLPSLRMLELVRNRLDGALEGGAFDAISLDTLDVSENQLHGELPAGVGNLFGLKELYVSWNRLSGPVPKTLGRLQQLLNMNLSHNLFSGRIPGEIGGCERLTMLDLSINQLRGSIPVALGKLEVLGVLNLSRNELSGSIPKELALLRGLNTADFSYNRLSGPIPKTEQLFNASSYIGNLGLCGAPFGPCSKTSGSGSASAPRAALRHRNRINKNEPGLLAWLVGALFSAALLVLVVGVCCFFRKYRHYILGLLRRDPNSAKAWKLTAFQRLDFSASQVLESMNDDNIIGRGGSGTVYKGVMPSGEVVAVKRLASFTGRKGMVSNHSDHGFSAEVQTLGKIRHRNIVKLLGCCSNKETNILLYEYMPNGSLGEALHDKKGPLLDWPTRYKIALQAANGLCYLHHDCSPLIVHRDVKSNNILLNTEFQAHVADFGLAKLFQDSGKSESMSSIAGSYGYIAPEYAYTLKVNEKSDIYSFGVVLLELVTGRRPIEAEFGDGVDIVQWVRKKIQTNDGLLEVVDSRIGGENLPLHEVMLVLRVGLLCTIELPVDRPTMRDVVQMLSDVKPNKSKESTDFAELSSRAQLISV